jgi:hypothetical protein
MNRRIIHTLGGLLFAGIAGCGGGSNNDNGVGFTLVGFNSADATTRVCQAATFVSQIAVPLSEGSRAEGAVPDVGIFQCLSIQNNMTTQAVKTDRAHVDYFIQGAGEQPPSTTTAMPLFLTSATASALGAGTLNTQPGTKPGSTFPGTAGGSGTTTTGGTGARTNATGSIAILPPAVREWLSIHRESLPPRPFEMIITVQVSGVTSSGDRIESNELPLTAIVYEDNTF